MNLSSTSWIRQPDDSYSLEELRCVYCDQCHALSPSASYPARITASSPLESSSHEAAVTRLRALHTTATYDVTLNGTGHLIKGRTHREVLADLRRLRGEANTLVLRRLLFRWGLYAVRRAALRELEHDTRLLLWQRLGGRCFAWWRLVTERRLCREALYEEAAGRPPAGHRWSSGVDAVAAVGATPCPSSRSGNAPRPREPSATRASSFLLMGRPAPPTRASAATPAHSFYSGASSGALGRGAVAPAHA